MYHTGVNPLRGVRRGASERVESVRGLKQRRLHKAFLRYHDAENWPVIREALNERPRAVTASIVNEIDGTIAADNAGACEAIQDAGQPIGGLG